MSQDDKLNDRLAAAKRIANRPGDYKICAGCDSIVLSRAVLCPSCHAYRFETDHEAVAKKAVEIASRPQETVTAADLKL